MKTIKKKWGWSLQQWVLRPTVSAVIFVAVILILGGISIRALDNGSLDDLKSDANANQLTAENRNDLLEYVKVHNAALGGSLEKLGEGLEQLEQLEGLGRIGTQLEQINLQLGAIDETLLAIRDKEQCGSENGEISGIVKSFTTSTTWTVPEGVTKVNVFAVGGGGGGAGDGSRAGHPGNGGNGGEVKFSTVVVSPGEKISVTIGKGGAGGGVRVYPSTAKDGGTTSFGNYLKAVGGAHGLVAYTAVSEPQTVIVGQKIGGLGVYNNNGRDGADGVECPFGNCSPTGQFGAAGGGGSDSYQKSGSVGGKGGAGGGGKGGGGQDNANTNKGSNATFYGGGGGGGAFSSSHTYSQGGDGYQGIVIIQY